VALVSVLMPVRNGARFLDAAIASVLSDPAADLELIAADDASHDETPAILRRWAARDARLRVLTLERPHGSPAARNRCLEVARGEFAAPHDADDVFVAARLAPQVELLRRDPHVALVCGSAEIIDARGRRLLERVVDETPAVMGHLLTFGNAVVHPTAMMRTADLRELGGYDESQEHSHDYELWLRLRERGSIAALPAICVRYRWHGGQMTAQRDPSQRADTVANTGRVLRAALGREPETVELESAASVWREDGRRADYSAANRVFREALSRSPHRGDRAFVERIRLHTARHWVAASSRLALARHPADAAVCLRYATRWHRRVAAGAVATRTAYFARMAVRRPAR
jgi:glycosyltransferase involved in cell wall biosynthesis